MLLTMREKEKAAKARPVAPPSDVAQKKVGGEEENTTDASTTASLATSEGTIEEIGDESMLACSEDDGVKQDHEASSEVRLRMASSTANNSRSRNDIAGEKKERNFQILKKEYPSTFPPSQPLDSSSGDEKSDRGRYNLERVRDREYQFTHQKVNTGMDWI